MLNDGTIRSGFGRNGFVSYGTSSTLQNDGTITPNQSSNDLAALVNVGEIGTSTSTSVLNGIDEGNLASTSGSGGGGLFNNT